MTSSNFRVSLVATPQQRHEWDALSAHPAVGHMHQCMWWAEPLDRCGLRSSILGCWKDDQLVGGGLFRSYSVPLTGTRVSECLDGPIFLDWEASWAEAFVAEMAKIARDENSMAVVIKGCPRKDIHEAIFGALKRAGLRATLRPGGADAMLPLKSRTLNDIGKGFNHGTRSRINKGQNGSLTVRRLTNSEDLRQAYTAWMATAARKGFTDVRPWPALHPVLRHCVAKGLGSVLASFQEDRLLAAAFVTHIGDTALWVYGGYIDGSEQANPTHLLQYEAIRESLEKGKSSYNFGSLISFGQSKRNGVDEFKLGFGATAHPKLDTIIWERKPFLYRSVQRLRGGRIGRRLEALLKRRLTQDVNEPA